MYRHTILWISLGLFTVTLAQAQAPDTSRIQDALLSHLVGKWTTTGEVRGDSVQYGAVATWGLGHQFLRLRMSDINDPPQYAAHVYVGYDPSAEQYVAHWRHHRRTGVHHVRHRPAVGQHALVPL